MWETPAVSASSNGLCEGWDRFTVPRFAWAGHFHGFFGEGKFHRRRMPLGRSSFGTMLIGASLCRLVYRGRTGRFGPALGIVLTLPRRFTGHLRFLNSSLAVLTAASQDCTLCFRKQTNYV